MMDFEGIEKVRERVQQNGTLYQQLQQAMEQLQKLSAIIDMQNGTNMSDAAGAAAQAAGSTGGGSGGTTDDHQQPGRSSGQCGQQHGHPGSQKSHECEQPEPMKTSQSTLRIASSPIRGALGRTEDSEQDGRSLICREAVGPATERSKSE